MGQNEQFTSISPERLDTNLFQAIGKDWMLVTVPNGDTVNPMTASWGGTGILWTKPVAFVFLRPQRYTRELMDQTEVFSLAFLDEQYRQQLGYCGSHSGRDEDKMAHCGFRVAREGAVPYIEQAKLVLLCKKLYRQPLEAAGFIEKDLDTEHYPGKDHHVLYVGEIEKILKK